MQFQEKWWNPKNFSQKREFCEARNKVTKAIRRFFDGQDFEEVETPILQICPVMDTHIRAFATDLKGVDGAIERQLYLHTSPEFAMKKLLVAGMERIYQICHVFRNAELSSRHSPEFTILEWYRAGANYKDIMQDCEELLRACLSSLGQEEFVYQSHRCNPFKEWKYLSVCEAFQEYASIELECYLEDIEAFKAVIAEKGMHVAVDDAWDDLFFRVMMEKIEPFLGMDSPTILYDYPVCMASLSKRKEEDPRFAERFELYVCGVELANAFSELTDPKEQAQRFSAEMDMKEKLYGERYPVDDDFLEALEYGLPPSGGIALGIDRLVMLCSGRDNIEDVLWAGLP